jgi:hypothetical protein
MMVLDSSGKKMIEDIINRREGIKSMNEQLKEDIKITAERMGVKPGQLGKIISLVERERAKGEVLEGEREIIEAADSIVNN